ncbi:hypothetical protein [Desulfolucanica intricata]|uniref:hypothetical protein n=1 Tax=Desulfolucanica intricata TaxID=1285191 RepID=UPI000A5AFE40|nr:hypothetical protein [Desulfolucanica intricata]
MDRLIQIMVEHTHLAKEAICNRNLSPEEKSKVIERIEALRKERDQILQKRNAIM